MADWLHLSDLDHEQTLDSELDMKDMDQPVNE